jgi:tetratricopeptide (TPR) repeat protein
LGAIANIYRQVGEQELAQKYYDQAIALHEESGDRYNLCSTCLGKAELYLMREEYARAVVLIEQAKQVAGEVQRQDILFQAGLVEARLLGKTGQEENGRQQLEAMLPPQITADRHEEVAHIYYVLWQIENRPEYASQAVAAYQAAFALAPKVRIALPKAINRKVSFLLIPERNGSPRMETDPLCGLPNRPDFS